VKSVA
jgi:hypothetical protein